MGLSVQLEPSSRPNVAFGRDGALPERFVMRRRFLRPSAAVALAVFYFAGWEQAKAYASGDYPTLAGMTLLSWGALAVAFVRYRMVLDTRLGELREEFGLFFPFARKSQPLGDVRRVVVTDEVRSVGEDGRETLYGVDLAGGKTRVRVDSVGLWEQAVPLAEALARFLRKPLRDERRAGDLDLEELDVPLRERELEGGPAGRQPRERGARVTADRPGLLRVDIPRPAVPQTLFLVGVVAAFCLIPLLIEGLQRRRDWFSMAFLSLPILIVGSGALRYIARNGGTLSVTPEALRFARHGLLWKGETVIAAEELEDLTIVQPEMGGARSLLAYFSSGVIVARSDRASCRFGYALPKGELEWLRSRVLEVLRQGARRFPRLKPSESEPAEATLPLFPRWSRLWLGMLAGGLVGRLLGGPLAVCVALPFLEEVLNTGALVGLLAAAALTPSLFPRGGGGRFVALGLGVFASVLLLSLVGLLQEKPSFDERWAFGSRPYGMVVDERRLRAGLLVASAVCQALALNALLLAGFRLIGGFTPRLRVLAAELASSVRAYEGIAPVRVVLGLAAAGVAVAALGAQLAPRDNRSYAISYPTSPPREAPRVSTPPARPPATESPVPAGQMLVERPPGAPGSATEWVPEPRARLTGRLLFAGRPLHEATQERARFWFRDEGVGTQATLAASHDPSSSEFRVAGVPGKYLVEVSAGRRIDQPPHVSYIGSQTFLIVEGAPKELDVPLQRILRLRQPVDNGRSLPPSGTPNPVHDSPVRFAWDALPEATSYRVVVRSFGGGQLLSNDERKTDRPEIELALAPGAYDLRLSAYGPSGLVGRLEVYGTNYRAWSYAFSVR